jgi:molecular chaperone GrpE
MSLSKNIHRIPIRRRGEELEKETAGQSASEQAVPQESKDREASKSDTPTKDQPPRDAVRNAQAAWRERVLRLKAELDRCYARQDERVATLVTEEQRDFLRSFLPIVDNLEQALTHMRRDDPLHQGVRATYEGILSLLARHDVEPLAAVGEPFDPDVHEAATMIAAPPTQREPLLVVDQIRSGYTWNDRLLRPARVVVAKRA